SPPISTLFPYTTLFRSEYHLIFLIHTDKHDDYHMIFELADGGSLREHLKNHFDDLTWKDKYKLGLGITNGLKYLHELDIIHKDRSEEHTSELQSLAYLV